MEESILIDNNNPWNMDFQQIKATTIYCIREHVARDCMGVTNCRKSNKNGDIDTSLVDKDTLGLQIGTLDTDNYNGDCGRQEYTDDKDHNYDNYVAGLVMGCNNNNVWILSGLQAWNDIDANELDDLNIRCDDPDDTSQDYHD